LSNINDLYSDTLSLLLIFVDDLKKLPAPEVAVKYYTEGDLYLFGKFFLFNKQWLHLIYDVRHWDNNSDHFQMNFKLPELPILVGQK
jgi:hypothetical protein